MKHFAFVFALAGIASFSSAAASNSLPGNDLLRADRIYIPVDPEGQPITLLDLATLTPQAFSKLTGRKMNFIQRLGFLLMQKKLRKNLNSDGTVNFKRFEKLRRATFLDSEYGFNAYGFSEGLLFGPLGVLSIYLISGNVDETLRRNRVKWAWIGAGVCALLVAALFIMFAAA